MFVECPSTNPVCIIALLRNDMTSLTGCVLCSPAVKTFHDNLNHEGKAEYQTGNINVYKNIRHEIN